MLPASIILIIAVCVLIIGYACIFMPLEYITDILTDVTGSLGISNIDDILVSINWFFVAAVAVGIILCFVWFFVYSHKEEYEQY